MKFERSFFVLCENALIDKIGRVSLINIYDIVNAPSVPAYHGRIIFASHFKVISSSSSKDVIKPRLSFKTPSGKELIKADVIKEREIIKSRQEQSVGFITEVNGVVFEEFGKYEAKFFIEKKELMSAILEVKKTVNE